MARNISPSSQAGAVEADPEIAAIDGRDFLYACSSLVIRRITADLFCLGLKKVSFVKFLQPEIISTIGGAAIFANVAPTANNPPATPERFALHHCQQFRWLF